MKRIELALGLNRCGFLTASEKSSLFKKLDNLKALTVLSIEEISFLTGRCIDTKCWEPASLQAIVEHDTYLMNMFGINMVSIDSADYPPLLREIHDPPFALFWRGFLPDPEKPLVAIVGTRSPTGDGVYAAARIAKEFAESGISVISGLARGIDAFAHKGNIEGGGKSVGVLASGVDRIYPASNKILAARMLQHNGCLLSEYSPGELPLKFRFPQRNRIISGLARSILVIEAPEHSGALITADFALEQGRDLFVGKDALHSARSSGTRCMHSQGARAIQSAEEVLLTWTDFVCMEKKPGAVSAKRPMNAQEAGLQLAFEFRQQLGLPVKGV